jgi:predicted nucleic acid-binding protein
MRFVDTSVLLYRVSLLDADAVKHRIATDLLSSANLRLSVQVLQEFYVQATRRTRDAALNHEEATGLIRSWKRFQPTSITPEIMEAALAACERWGISYWDAAILEAARSAGCDTVLSEDLNDTQNYGGVRVVNPFR